MRKSYLGDGAYVEPGSYAGEVVLTASDGIRTTNVIVLDPHALTELFEYVKVWRMELAGK